MQSALSWRKGSSCVSPGLGPAGCCARAWLCFPSNLRVLAKHHLAAPRGCSLGRGFHKGLLSSLVFITLASAAACQLAEVSSPPGVGESFHRVCSCFHPHVPRGLPATGRWDLGVTGWGARQNGLGGERGQDKEGV